MAEVTLTKICKKCGQTKGVSAFSRLHSDPNGFPICRQCNYSQIKLWRRTHSRAGQAKRWRDKNPAKAAATDKRYYEKNREALRPILAEKERQRRRNEDPQLKRVRLQKYKRSREATLAALAGRPRASKCEICNTVCRAVFDHSHATGGFRGWLCDRCNRTLGTVEDSVPLLRKMIRYLRKFEKCQNLTPNSARPCLQTTLPFRDESTR